MEGKVIIIEIKKRNRFKEFPTRIKSKFEDLMLTIIPKLPVIPQFLMNWLEQYTNKRITELNQQIIHDRWHSMKLEKTVNEIHIWQDKEKAPSED